LGLALVKRLVEAQSGWVAVRSTPGQGSTFSAILPRQADVIPPDEASTPARVLPGPGTVLVVDDDPATLKLAEVALRQLGHVPVCKSNGPDALRAAESDLPALVIVDLLMPQMDGFEFIARLRALRSGADVPILVWTIKDLDDLEQRRLKASAAAVVFKRSGGANALVEEVRRLLPLAPVATTN
jgi:CheY-like chemotaxis protein